MTVLRWQHSYCHEVGLEYDVETEQPEAGRDRGECTWEEPEV